LQAVPNDLIELAQRAANLSRPILRRYFRAGLDIVRKGDESPVTQADRQAETAIRQLLNREAPEHGIIGEEQAHLRHADRADSQGQADSGRDRHAHFGRMLGWRYRSCDPIQRPNRIHSSV
jgi:3'-phosphoadenosine 5'-phosphosulfate (PAPS) 3'-phosphatase